MHDLRKGEIGINIVINSFNISVQEGDKSIIVVCDQLIRTLFLN